MKKLDRALKKMLKIKTLMIEDTNDYFETIDICCDANISIIDRVMRICRKYKLKISKTEICDNTFYFVIAY